MPISASVVHGVLPVCLHIVLLLCVSVFVSTLLLIRTSHILD